MRLRTQSIAFAVVGFVCVLVISLSAQGRREEAQIEQALGPNQQKDGPKDGKRLFERETFGGNGRTCLTCHSRKTGTVSPQDAQDRFYANPQDPLFLHDGSDDGLGHGVTRILSDATILMKIPLHPSVRLADSTDRFVIVRRGIPTTLNTPALDPVLMQDGRQPTLELQAGGAIQDHAQGTAFTLADLENIKQFQMTDAFFSSPELRDRARGGPQPKLPKGSTPSEKRGRRFFEDVPPDSDVRHGLCSHCHSGTLMNQTSEFAPLFFGVPVKTGTRFQDILVSTFNDAGNPVREFIFTQGDGTEVHKFSPDPGRALITGALDDPITFENFDAFKIPQLRGVADTAPYFHDNSAKTLEAVAAHYTRFFNLVSGGFVALTLQDEADMVAFMKLLK